MATPQVTTVAAGLTGDAVVDALTTGYKWVLGIDRTVDWSISSGFNGEIWTDPAGVRDYVDVALRVYSYYADIHFNYVGTYSSPAVAASAGSEIDVTMDGSDTFFSETTQWARGFFPSSASNSVYSGAAGDIYLNINSPANHLSSYDPGSVGWTVLIHEIGHALGLKHPFDDGGTGHPTLAQLGYSDLDSNLWTIMSYTDTYDWNQVSWHPATPMALDVIAIQYLYGKNLATNAGNSFYDLTETDEYQTVWDASGIDTLDFEHAAGAWSVLLPRGPISDLVDTKVGFALPSAEADLDQPHTLDWLTGDYEKVIGTAFGDLIEGNNLGNTISAGAGADTVGAGDGANAIFGEAGDDSIAGGAGVDSIDGGAGNNSLDGGAGADTILGGVGQDSIRGLDDNDSIDGGGGGDDLNGNRGQDTVHGGSGADSVRGGQGNDLIYGDDGDDLHVNGNIGDDTVQGGAGADTVFGGQGNDLVVGDDGNDSLSGDLGSDTLTGGAGADLFHLGFNGGHDYVTDFSAAAGDRVVLDHGAVYTVAQSGADTLLTLATGEQLTLQGVSSASLPTGWIIVS